MPEPTPPRAAPDVPPRAAPDVAPPLATDVLQRTSLAAELAVGLLVFGAHRQRELLRAVERNVAAPLSFRLVMLFTVGGVLLALTTVVLVLAQT